MTYPKISIVTASFNSVSYIEKAIQSVLTQTYPNIEYIVMDGGSTDGTIDILKKYEGKLTWISEPDKSIYDALNKGFTRATGDVFTWLDSDNFYESPEVLSKIAKVFVDTQETDIVMTNGKLWYSDRGEMELVDSPVLTFSELLARGNCFMPESVFYKKEFFRNAGGLDISYRLIADYELWLKIWRSKPRITKLPLVSAVYVVRNDALLRKDPFLAWKETFALGALYQRPIIDRIRIRLLFVWEHIKFPFYRFIKARPRLHVWYIRNIRPILKKFY